MGRPIPPVIDRAFVNNSPRELIVSVTEGFWVVTYAGQPINILTRNTSPEIVYSGMKYSRNGFPHRGHAVVLARKLNKMFNTDQYQVIKVI